MLSLNDDRWNTLTGGYRMEFDPRPLLAILENGDDPAPAWQELWDELHHQGDVGDASYAAIPHIVRIHRKRGLVDWNTYAIVAVIDLARTQRENPKLPEGLESEYFAAIGELAAIGSVEILRTEDPDVARAILSVIAIGKNLRTHARFLIEYSEDELSVRR